MALFEISELRYNKDMTKRRFLVSVIGGNSCSPEDELLAEKVGSIVASNNAVLVSGGLKGTMAAACKGARNAGGLTLGFIPGLDKDEANEFVDIVINTGMSYSRNTLVAGSADMVVALPGKYGTLSEIGFALNAGVPVYGLGTWDIPGVIALDCTEAFEEAVIKEMEKI